MSLPFSSTSTAIFSAPFQKTKPHSSACRRESAAMAVNLCPGSPTILCASPRISFSHDLDPHDCVARSDHPRLSSTDSDFEFRLPALQFSDETSTADELFSGGMIVPTNIKQLKPNPPSPPQTEEEEEDGIIVTSTRANLIREEKGNSKSFWRFMRSSSLNSDSKKASIWSSLPLLARSNSTGSSPRSNAKQHSHGGNSSHRKSPKPLSSGFHHKPPLGKSYSVVAPVLNVPPPYIAKGTSDLLGFGSLFRHGNEKKGKKR